MRDPLAIYLVDTFLVLILVSKSLVGLLGDYHVRVQDNKSEKDITNERVSCINIGDLYDAVCSHRLPGPTRSPRPGLDGVEGCSIARTLLYGSGLRRS